MTGCSSAVSVQHRREEFLHWWGRGASHPAATTRTGRERSVGGAWDSFKTSPPSDGCHLCLTPTPPRPFLMKPDFLFCSASPLISSTGALYNGLMLIVANKSTFLPPFLLRPPSHTQAWSVPGTPWITARKQRRSGVMKKHSGRRTHTLTHSC